MVWDMAGALRKKAETESARLQAFGFHQRVRAISLVARSHGLDGAAVAPDLAILPDALLLARLASLTGQPAPAVASQFQAALATAWQQLAREQGDPSPHRLA